VKAKTSSMETKKTVSDEQVAAFEKSINEAKTVDELHLAILKIMATYSLYNDVNVRYNLSNVLYDLRRGSGPEIAKAAVEGLRLASVDTLSATAHDTLENDEECDDGGGDGPGENSEDE
jgi:hypothetical protein